MATHKKSLKRQEADKYKRHNIPMSGLTNLWSNPDGMMHNSTADNVLAHSVQKREGKAQKCQLTYGQHLDERNKKSIDCYENGVKKTKYIYIRSSAEDAVYDEKSGRVVGIIMRPEYGGEYIDKREDITPRGWTASGFYQMCIKDAKDESPKK